jgi:excisionase family DNA binding protein
MSGFAWAVMCFLGGLLVIAFGELVSEEFRGWLDLLPRGVLWLAARRLDPMKREFIYDDGWLPELTFALRGDESRPITRVIKGTYFALGLFIAARKAEAIPPTVSTTAPAGALPAAVGPLEPRLSDVRFLAVGEVATIMRVSKMTVYRLVHSGDLEAIRVGRSFRVPEGAVNQYLRSAFTGLTDDVD